MAVCQATVYLEQNGERELVMNEVANLWVEGDTVWVSQFLEQPVAIHAVVRSADFMTHTVLLMAIGDKEQGEA